MRGKYKTNNYVCEVIFIPLNIQNKDEKKN